MSCVKTQINKQKVSVKVTSVKNIELRNICILV